MASMLMALLLIERIFASLKVIMVCAVIILKK